MIEKILIKKILWYKNGYYSVNQVARITGISRSVVGYWWGCWKRKPKKVYTPENIEAEYALLKAEKLLQDSKILKGKFNQDDPVGEGRRLRRKWIAKYDIEPEKL